VKKESILLFTKKKWSNLKVEAGCMLLLFFTQHFLFIIFLGSNALRFFLNFILIFWVWKLYALIENFILLTFKSLDLRKEKRSLKSKKWKRKSLIVYILATENPVISVNWFHSTREILLRCFLHFILLEKKSKLRKKILFPV